MSDVPAAKNTEAGGLLEMYWHLVTWGGEVEIVRPKRLQRLMEELRMEGRQ